ncbi:MAG: hypothetical protein QM845_01655 [Verrucomicrobiota bacterium]|nr:hypothetical protein [Verrucomicrobiota bacterium]HNZ23472.1 hypothetical protein [Polyangiaceae bacterium]HOH01243.1 hypothetical protein [Polyangiaceae bacterium]
MAISHSIPSVWKALRVIRPQIVAVSAGVLTMAMPAFADPPPGQSAWLNGMHDIESLGYMQNATSGCDKGWITDLQYIGAGGQPSTNCHDAAVAAGISIIQRLDVDGSHSFPLDPAQAPGYASAFASFASQCPNTHVWIVGNEPNFTTNNADPESYASPYAEAYAKVHAALHAISGHHNDLVLVAPASPYSPFCICSMHRIIQQIVARGVQPDGFAIHAYTQAQHSGDYGSLASLVTSEDMSASNDGCGYPFHWQFRIYRDWIAAIEKEGHGGKPVFITETGNACAPQQGNSCYPNQDVGYFQAMFQEINAWNQDPSHTTKIRAITPYRWTLNDDGTGRDFAIGNRPALLDDLTHAFSKKYAWTTPASCESQPNTCTDDASCSGSTICDLTKGNCASISSCGNGGVCPTGEICREATFDCAPSTRGAANITFEPSNPAPGSEVTIDVSGTAGYTNVGLSFEAVPGATVPTELVAIEGTGPYHWKYKATAGATGTYRATFVADPGASTVYAIGYVNVGDVFPDTGGSGGAGGTGGAAGTGGMGTGGSGGISESGGASGSGGGTAGSSGGAAGSSHQTYTNDTNDEGCGCTMPGVGASQPGYPAILALIALHWAQRRRRSTESDRSPHYFLKNKG